MQTIDTVEGNSKIAEFMGIDVYETYEQVTLVPIDKLNRYFLSGQGKYHTSWDWLMPVVEKLEKLGFKTVLATSDWGCKYYQNIMTGVGIIKETIDNPSKFMGQSDSKIQAVWLAVVEFIQWFNNQNKTDSNTTTFKQNRIYG